MFSGPTKTRAKSELPSNTSGKSIPENDVLKNYHDMTMKDPVEVRGSSRSMLLSILAQVAKFMKLAAALLDNLKGKISPEEQKKHTTENVGNTHLPKKEEARTSNAFDQYQARLYKIPLVKVEAPPPASRK